MDAEIKKIITPIPPELPKERRWSVKVNGEEIKDVNFVELHNPKVHTVWYGLHPSGEWAGIGLRTHGGGGVALIPFFEYNGEIFIGLIKQNRPYQDQESPVLNIPRNHCRPEEDHAAAAQRIYSDFFEPALKRLRVDYRSEIFPLGFPVNKDSALFITYPGDGVYIYGAQISADFGAVLGEIKDPKRVMLIVGMNNFDIVNHGLVSDLVQDVCFVHWTSVLQLADGYTNTAVARLLAHKLR